MPQSNDDKVLLNDSSGSKRFPFSADNWIENALDAIVAFDSYEQITYWNPAAELMFGWKAGEALGRTPAELSWPALNSGSLGEQKRAEKSEEASTFFRGEQEMCDREGRPIWAEYTTGPIFDEGGKTMGFVSVYHDIKKYKQVETALHARTEEMETLLEVSPIALFVAHDPECKRITGNPAGYQLVNLPENGYKNISKSAPKQEQPGYRVFREGVELSSEDLPMQAAARQGIEVFDESLELRFEDGSHKYIYAYARPLIGESGMPRGAIAAMLDITERKRAEELLERSNQKLSDILASIQDDFYVLDHDWVFVYASKRFTSRIGKEPEDFVGNNIWKMFPKHLGTILEENFRAAMEKREVRRFEIPGKYTDAWYRMTAFPSKEGITVLGTDITDRKHLEREIESLARFPNENPNPVLRIHRDGIIAFANAASDNLLCLWNRSVGERLPEPEHKLILHVLESQTATEQELDCTGRIYSLIFTPIPESDYVNIYGRDITERKQAEEALRKSEEELIALNETLEQKVNEQTAELRRLTTNLTKAEQRERRRIAHILHEDLQQRLYVVKMQLTFLAEGLKNTDPDIEAELIGTNKQIDEILALTRNLTLELSPPILRDEGLTQALTWLASQMHEKQGLRVEVQSDESFAIAEKALQVLLFNCVRELLFNIVKHAGVDRAVVALQRSNNELRIEVWDEGKGFNVATLFDKKNNIGAIEDGKSSFGLPTLRHQLGLLGGHMDIQSEPNKGTRIFITVPYS